MKNPVTKETLVHIFTDGGKFIAAIASPEVYKSLSQTFPNFEVTEKHMEEPTAAKIAGILLGGIGASKGGLARSQSLSKERRREIAMKANAARWQKIQGPTTT